MGHPRTSGCFGVLLFSFLCNTIIGQTTVEYHPNGTKSFAGSYAYIGVLTFARRDLLGMYDPTNPTDGWSFRELPAPNRVYDGTCRFWHENGKLAMVGRFVHGLADSVLTYWYANGGIRLQADMRLGVPVGKYLEWQDSGLPMVDFNYAEFTKDEMDSIYAFVGSYSDLLWQKEAERDRAFQQDAQLRWYTEKLNPIAKRHGTFTFYDDQGGIEARLAYADGRLNGGSSLFFGNGQVSEMFTYRNDTCWGTSRTFAIDGQQLSEMEIQDNDVRVTDLWDDNGRKMVASGRGRMVRLNAVGQKEEEGEYVDGRKQGAWTVYRLNGLPQLITEYLNGLVLNEREYDENGEIQQERVFRGGELDLTRQYSGGKVVGEHRAKDGY